MSYKELTKPYECPIRITYKVVAGPTDIHPINLTDVIFDEYDFKIRKMDPKTHKFKEFI